MPTCLRASVVYMLTCLRASAIYVPTCQKRANFVFLPTNVPINVPTCYTACQCFNLACQRSKRRAKFSSIPLKKCCYYSYTYDIMYYDASYIKIVLDFIFLVLGKPPRGELRSPPPPATLKLTLILTQTLTSIGGQFSLGAIVRIPIFILHVILKKKMYGIFLFCYFLFLFFR